MNVGMERVSRSVAVVALLASAAFFAWYGLALAASAPATGPLFAGMALIWVVAAVGVTRKRIWGPSFAAGLSTVSIVTMLPAGLHPSVRVFLAAQVILLAALAARSVPMADERARAEEPSWRHTGLAYATGIATPYLLVVGLFPGLGFGASLLALCALAVGGAGIAAAFRGRTWGLLAMAGAIPLALAIPETGLSCHAGLHDRAGELASVGLGLALIPWVSPVLRRLRGDDSAPR